jgi:MarR family transcriptional regulator, organic hydroperoxide resistance regulator
MEAASELGPVLEFMQVLWELEQGLNRRSQAMLRQHGVTGPQRLVIRVLARLGPVSPASLARVLRLHPASVTRLAQALEIKGMVRRSLHPTDKRQILLELGPAGVRVNRTNRGTVEHAIEGALAESAPHEVRAAIAVIQRAVERLGA